MTKPKEKPKDILAIVLFLILVVFVWAGIALLLLLVQNEGKMLGTEYLYQRAWGQPMSGDKNAVRISVSRLRRKIAPAGYVILSERGSGYLFKREK